MTNKGIKYEFLANPYRSSTTEGIVGWVFVSLPKEQSAEIRSNFKCLEEGWGRMKITAKIGNSEWKTAVWFDTKQGTYLLPLKSAIRKKEKVELDNDINVTIFV